MPPRAALAALAACGCIGGVTPEQCAIDTDCGAHAFCAEGACIGGTRTCPNLQPTFSSINDKYLQVGCGVRQINCHGTGSSAIESGPALAGHPYAALVNARAANRQGSQAGLVLVKPGDPDGSFLLVKLRLATTNDPRFGSGQPATAPGSTCAETLAVIGQWIQSGAPDN